MIATWHFRPLWQTNKFYASGKQKTSKAKPQRPTKRPRTLLDYDMHKVAVRREVSEQEEVNESVFEYSEASPLDTIHMPSF